MDLSIVIVNWNSGQELRALLDSLSSVIEQGVEVIVVDNSSDDNSADGAADRAGVRLVAFQENRGFAAAANQGISLARCPLVLLLNPDIRLTGEAVRLLHDRACSRPGAAILTGALIGLQ